jgi:2-polyprenyl-3-methyl-5-hydroxy-6-metoxy-1,4-benzoquinol methylase
MESDKIKRILTEAANAYPPDMVKEQVRDIPRMLFHISLVLETVAPKTPEMLSICDLGGGVGIFSVGCAMLGFKRVVLVDDFKDSINLQVGDSIFSIHRKHGVQIVSRDVVSEGMGTAVGGSLDAIVTFDSMEHWHNSPKKLFREVMEKLNPGGIFILGTPNCVNLRKRISVPLGIGEWTSMRDWYETETFRGHVREPNVGNLKYIARDMGLTQVKILGRNWQGHLSPKPLFRLASKILDYPLRIRPSLCSNLYMTGRKP